MKKIKFGIINFFELNIVIDNLIEIGVKKVSSKLRYFSDLLAKFVNEFEFQRVDKKLKKQNIIADVDDQRLHHFTSY